MAKLKEAWLVGPKMLASESMYVYDEDIEIFFTQSAAAMRARELGEKYIAVKLEDAIRDAVDDAVYNAMCD